MNYNIKTLRDLLSVAQGVSQELMHDARAALAELERATADLAISRDFYQKRCDALQSWQSKMRDPERTIVCDILANGFTLDPAGDRYTAPPAPVAEIREVAVTDEMARKVFNAWIDARWRLNEGQDTKYGHAMINVVRSELGPALGLVGLKEPTPEECERICTEYERLLMREGTCGGRDAFDAVRAVMWPKSEGL